MNHYQLLGVKQTASKEEIRKAYKKLALKLHPDKNKDPNAEPKFRAVKKAYEILQDDQKRNAYDEFDLTQVETKKRTHRDGNFFTGASDRLTKEQLNQAELDRIRRINSELLDSKNAELRSRRRPTRAAGASREREVSPEESFEDYEKRVLARLRACESS